MSEFLLIAGIFFLSVALRRLSHPLFQRLGWVALLVVSYLIGYFLTGSIVMGVLAVASWFLLPWLEILTRVRRLRFSPERHLHASHPPSRETFPALRDLSRTLEEEGFEQIDDTGWEWEEQRHFVRIFARKDEAMQATISLIEQERFAFYYVSYSSRSRDGRSHTTWDYPFSYSMRLPPQMRVNRVRRGYDLVGLLAAHREFLQREGVRTEELLPVSEETAREEMQEDFNRQIAYNLESGLLLRAEEGRVRYSWRGYFFIWTEFLRDVARLS